MADDPKFNKNEVVFEEYASGHGADPNTGNWKISFKADGMYVTDDAGNETGPLTSASSINKNVLPNPGFRTSQRGDGPFTASPSQAPMKNNDGNYLLDGTVLLSDGNDIVDVSKVADSDFVSGYKCRLDVETANKRFGILKIVEQKNALEIIKNGVASLQFKVKCTGSSMSNVRAYILSWVGTADSPTKDIVSGTNWGNAGGDPTFVANWTVENTPANLAVTTSITTHQIQNVAIDTGGVVNLAILVIVDDTDAQIGDFLEISDIKLEKGAVCTEYQNDPIEQEEEEANWLCFVQKTPGGSGDPIAFGAGVNTTTGFIYLQFPRRMRTTPATPTIAAGTISAVGDFQLGYAGNSYTCTGVTISQVTPLRCQIVQTIGSASLAAGGGLGMNHVNNTGFIIFSAELGV